MNPRFRPTVPVTTARSCTPSRTLLALALAAVLPCAHAADADEAPLQKDPVQLEGIVATAHEAPYTVDSTTAATKLALSLRETPQSVTVITRERLDDQNLNSLREVLDNTTGVYSNAYDSERVLFFSRGFPVDGLMVDGVPALPNFNTGAIDETVDTAPYERIEIVRGATGLMNGAGSPGASVNLVRKHADATTPRASIDLSVGSWNDRRGEVDVAAALNGSGSVRGRVIAVYEDSEAYQALYHKKTTVLYGILDADLSPSTTLSFGFDYQNNKPRGNTWGSFPLFLADGSAAGWPRSITTAADWTFWNRRTQTVFGELHHAFDNDWQLRAVANWRRYDEDLALLYLYGFPDPVSGEGLEPSAYRSKGDIVERALDVYASGPFDLFGRRHELVLGYNGSRSRNTGKEYAVIGPLADPRDFFDWNGSYPKPGFETQGDPLADIRTRQNGAYAAARLSLADPLKLIAGARYATWKTDSFYRYDEPHESRYDYRQTIPYAGLVYDLGRGFSAFASYTGIFKPQNSRDAGGRWLDPVEGRSVELGIKGEHFDGGLNTALTVFQTRQDNVAAPVFDPETGAPVRLPDGTQVSRPIDGARTRGFEIEAVGRLGEAWNVSLGWSRQLTRDADGRPARTFVPATLVRLFATWKPPQLERLTLGAGLNWQSHSDTFVGSPDGGTTLRQGGVALASVMARYQFSPQVSLQLNASNLLDRKYYVLDEYDNTYYGAPASATLSLRVGF